MLTCSVKEKVLKRRVISCFIMLGKIKYKWDEKIGPIFYIKIGNKNYGICFCHRIKERSIKFFGIERYLCSRCLGILLGGVFAISLHFLNYHLSFMLSILLTVPLLLDGFTQFFNFRHSNNALRLFTGILFGVGLNHLGVLV